MKQTLFIIFMRLSLKQIKPIFSNAVIKHLNFLIEFSLGFACVRKIAGFRPLMIMKSDASSNLKLLSLNMTLPEFQLQLKQLLVCITQNRSSRQRVFYKKGVRKFTKTILMPLLLTLSRFHTLFSLN